LTRGEMQKLLKQFAKIKKNEISENLPV
jgi:hypothetical protein